MAEKVSKSPHPETQVTVEEVNRVLEVGRLLLSVLASEELEELMSLCGLLPSNSLPVDFSSGPVMGNTGVT